VWINNKFGNLNVPAGYVADVYCLVPMGNGSAVTEACVGDGGGAGCSENHAHGADELPNVIDPAGACSLVWQLHVKFNTGPSQLWTVVVDPY